VISSSVQDSIYYNLLEILAVEAKRAIFFLVSSPNIGASTEHQKVWSLDVITTSHFVYGFEL